MLAEWVDTERCGIPLPLAGLLTHSLIRGYTHRFIQTSTGCFHGVDK